MLGVAVFLLGKILFGLLPRLLLWHGLIFSSGLLL
jgi:hypothetical protein